MAEPFTTADFHNSIQKQVLNTVFDTLAQSKMDWKQVEPFLEAARAICRSDFEETGRVRIHAVRAEGDSWVEAEEAYVGVTVCDRDDGREWLSETWWLSDLITAENDREQVKAIIAAMERTIARLNTWLENGGGLGGPLPGTD